MVSPPLDLDEIARREIWLDPPATQYIKLTPAERDALVAAARDGVSRGRSELETELRAIIDRTSFAEVPSDIHNAVSRLVERARGPEMPADVAGTVARLKGVAEHQFEQHYGHVRTPKEQSILWQAATLIEALERQRQEAVATGEEFREKLAETLGRLMVAAACAGTIQNRAEQAEKERDEARGDLDKESAEAEASFTRLIEERDRREAALRGRLAKLEAVVTGQRGALTWIMLQRETALCGCRPYPGEPRCGWCVARDLASVKFDEAGIPVAALDRKEP